MKTINIKTIRIDGGTQSRVEINTETVTEYAEAIKAGTVFPPVVVFHDGVDNWLADGFHRVHAHDLAEKTSIVVDMRQGTARDAILYSLGSNDTHGLRRTNADKRKAVMTLLQDFDWSAFSNSEMAKICAVSQRYVNQIKADLTMNVHSEKPKEVTFKTKHGTTATMQTDNIGKRDAKCLEAAHSPNPKAPKPSAQEQDDSEYLITDDELLDVNTKLQEENNLLKDTIKSLNATNKDAEIENLLKRVYGLEGRLQQIMASEKAMEKNLKYHTDLIHKLRKVYGVETHKEILEAAQAQTA